PQPIDIGMRDKVTADHVIETYLLRTEGLDPHHSLDDSRVARDVIEKLERGWPEHAGALREYVETEWIVETGPDVGPDPDLEERIVRRGMEAARRLLEGR